MSDDLIYGVDYVDAIGAFGPPPPFQPIALVNVGGGRHGGAKIIRGIPAVTAWYADHARYAVQPVCYARTVVKGYPIGHDMWRSDRCVWCNETRRRCAGFGG